MKLRLIEVDQKLLIRFAVDFPLRALKHSSRLLAVESRIPPDHAMDESLPDSGILVISPESKKRKMQARANILVLRSLF